mgnify:CR=1 FL=1
MLSKRSRDLQVDRPITGHIFWFHRVHEVRAESLYESADGLAGRYELRKLFVAV